MFENRNLILALVLSVAVILGFELMRPKPDAAPAPEAPVAETAPTVAPTVPGDATPAPAPSAAPVPMVPGVADDAVQAREKVLAQVKRIRVNTPSLHGSISTKGARIDDLTLVNYHEKVNPESPEVVLLSPTGTENAYFAEFGWAKVPGLNLPDAETVWTADRDVLTQDRPVTLSWDNGQGLTFERVVAVDENYMFSITDRVRNATGQAVQVYPYGLISRSGTPETLGFYILHEGPLGVLDGTLTELDYADLQDGGPEKAPTTGGWLGITDKYWLTAVIPDQKMAVDTTFEHKTVNGRDRYYTHFLGGAMSAPAGGSVETTARLFAGAKEVKLLDAYTDSTTDPVERLDLAVDFGWFYFLTKPFFYALDFFANTVFAGVYGAFGLAIIGLTLVIKAVLFPLANKSYRSMSKMRKLQPEMKKLQERFKDDKQRLNQEMMALYKKEGASPVSGCLPIFVQIPVFFSLYKVLFISIEMRHEPFYGWVSDLSAPDPTTLFNLFGLLPFDPPSFLMIGAWPVVMGISMFLQQKLNPQPTDPVQAKIMTFLPLIFTVLLASFPVGLVIYWTTNNLLSMAQQWMIIRQTEKQSS